MRLLIPRLEKVRDMEPLAHEPALHVDSADEHGVDLAGFRGLLELVHG